MMKFANIYMGMLVAAVFCVCGNVGAQTITTIADAAGDYVDSLSAIDAAPTEFPDGWTYRRSDATTGGTETELTIRTSTPSLFGNTGFGLAGNTGFGVTPGVLGNHHFSDEFEIFNDGFDGNGGHVISGNEGVVGEDLLIVPGSANQAHNQFVIARYTISEADLVDSVPGTGSIVGSFRDLVVMEFSSTQNGGSVDVFVFHNDTALFSVDRDNDRVNGGTLTQAEGTFNITGLTFAEGDAISFVLGNNGHLAGDESALQAAISIESTGGGLTGDFDGSGVVDCDDLDFYIGNIGATATGELAPLDLNGDNVVDVTDANLVISTLVETSNGQVGTFPGDLNCDGSVDILGDAFALVASLGGSATSYSQGDIDFDGTVDVLGDAFLLVANLGSSNAP